MLDAAAQEVFDRARHPMYRGVAGEATHAAEGVNPRCGDEVRLTARVEGGTVRDIRHESRACAICTAATDLLCEYLQGKNIGAAGELDDEKMLGLLPIPVSPARLRCALLPRDATRKLEPLPPYNG